jgi:hypothetical protein
MHCELREEEKLGSKLSQSNGEQKFDYFRIHSPRLNERFGENYKTNLLLIFQKELVLSISVPPTNGSYANLPVGLEVVERFQWRETILDSFVQHTPVSLN